MDKVTIRREVLKRREQLDERERSLASLKLTDRIIGHQWFYLSDTILIFASYGSEIDTTGIIQEAFRKEKKVFVPKVEGEQMQFYRILSLEDLHPGYKGIPEPFCGASKDPGNYRDPERYEYFLHKMDQTLMIMPGVAFDPYNNRIGYGKGFYDRFLSDKEGLVLKSIGVGFQCQLVEAIPSHENDIRPYQVILV